MKLMLALRNILSMSNNAWYIFIRMIQLAAFLLLCAFILLLECSGQSGRSYELYMTAMSLNETSQALLLIAFILSACVESLQS